MKQKTKTRPMLVTAVALLGIVVAGGFGGHFGHTASVIISLPGWLVVEDLLLGEPQSGEAGYGR